MSPTARTLKFLRDRGWLVGNVEKFVRFPPPGHRVDLFGFCDLLAIKDHSIVFVQTCAGASHATRLTKVKANPNVPIILSIFCNPQVWVMSWRKAGLRDKRKEWKPRIERIWPGLHSEEINLETI